MNLRLALLVAATAAALAYHPTAARGDVASLRAELHGGVAGGLGVGGASKDDAFHAGIPPATYGALVGIELLFADVFLEHHQFTNGDRLATWTQLEAGFDVDLELGVPPQIPNEPRKPGKGYLELGLYAGFGVGTGQQVDPPLDNSEVTDKGLFLEGRASVGWRLGPLFRVGLTIPISGGYFVKSGPGVAANDLNEHYQSIQAAAMITLRANLKIK